MNRDHDWRPTHTKVKGGRVYRCSHCKMEKVGKTGAPMITCLDPPTTKPPEYQARPSGLLVPAA